MRPLRYLLMMSLVFAGCGRDEASPSDEPTESTRPTAVDDASGGNPAMPAPPIPTPAEATSPEKREARPPADAPRTSPPARQNRPAPPPPRPNTDYEQEETAATPRLSSTLRLPSMAKLDGTTLMPGRYRITIEEGRDGPMISFAQDGSIVARGLAVIAAKQPSHSADGAWLWRDTREETMYRVYAQARQRLLFVTLDARN